MQTLQVFQSMWAMEQRHPRHPEPAIADNFMRVAEAGFHGACLDPSVPEIEDTLALKPYFEQHGLACMLNVFPATADELLQAGKTVIYVAVDGRVTPRLLDWLDTRGVTLVATRDLRFIRQLRARWTFLIRKVDTDTYRIRPPPGAGQPEARPLERAGPRP